MVSYVSHPDFHHNTYQYPNFEITGIQVRFPSHSLNLAFVMPHIHPAKLFGMARIHQFPRDKVDTNEDT